MTSCIKRASFNHVRFICNKSVCSSFSPLSIQKNCKLLFSFLPSIKFLSRKSPWFTRTKVSNDTNSIKASPHRTWCYFYSDVDIIRAGAVDHSLNKQRKKSRKAFLFRKKGNAIQFSSSCSVNKDSSRCEFVKSSTWRERDSICQWKKDCKSN